MFFLKKLFKKKSNKEFDDQIENLFKSKMTEASPEGMVCNMFWGLHKLLLQMIHRNVDTIPDEVKKSPFFYEALVTYVDLFSILIGKPTFPRYEQVVRLAIRDFFNADYEIIDNLPLSKAQDLNLPWVRAMAMNIKLFRVHNTCLLSTIEEYIEQKTGKTVRYGVHNTGESQTNTVLKKN